MPPKGQQGPSQRKVLTGEVITERISLDELREQHNNPRHHTVRSQGMIEHSLRTLGAGRSLVVSGDNEVYAGSGTLEAARAAGYTEALIVETHGDVLLVHRRPDLDERELTEYSILDNRPTDLSYMDPEALAQIEATMPGLVQSAYLREEWHQILDQAQRQADQWLADTQAEARSTPTTEEDSPMNLDRAAADRLRAELIKIEKQLAACTTSREQAEGDLKHVLSYIPACPTHGSACVPWAIAWLTGAKDVLGDPSLASPALCPLAEAERAEKPSA